MRTQEEVLAKFQTELSTGFGFGAGVLLRYLAFDKAKPFLKDGVTEADWATQPADRESVLADAADYIGFGWEKCLGHRGISAGRTVTKMGAWMWLACDDEALSFLEDGANYAQYGAPVLAYLCGRFGWPMPDDEDARRMAVGKHCTADYDCGCGA